MGSEMCIRDSPHDAQKPQQLELEHTRLRGPREIKPIESQESEGKVSDRQEESSEAASSDTKEAVSSETKEKKTSESISLQDLGLANAVISNLEAGGVGTVEELVSKTSEDILGIRKIGPKAVEQINTALSDNGFSLKEI